MLLQKRRKKAVSLISKLVKKNKIIFGTDGWRGITGFDFNTDNVKIVAGAIARYLLCADRKKLEIYKFRSPNYKYNFQSPDKGIVIGYDSRFLSDKFARVCAETISSYNIPVYLTDEITPTPAISLAIKMKKCAGGIIITASHNPYEYNGIKFKAEYASSGLPEVMQSIQKQINVNFKKNYPAKPGLIKTFSAKKIYLNHLKKLVDLEKIKKSSFKIVVDSMYGAAAGYFEEIINKNIILIRNTRNPYFGGINPEPIDKNLGVLVTEVKKNKADIGFAFDGDGDRIGAVDTYGSFINSHHIFTILLWHLYKNRKLTGAVVKTFSTSEKVKLLANKFGLEFFEVPIGFKYICEHMLKDDILIGGEESGGIGVKLHIPERDGIFCALLLLEAMSFDGLALHQLLKKIMRNVGNFYYDRIDLKLKSFAVKDKIISSLKNNPHFPEYKIKEVKTLDGVKYFLDSESWILFRPSGTEPVLRIYCESENQKNVKNILEKGKALVKKLEGQSSRI